MSRVFIDKAENGWVLTYTHIFTQTEVYLNESELLTRVHQLINREWSVGDKVAVIKE